MTVKRNFDDKLNVSNVNPFTGSVVSTRECVNFVIRILDFTALYCVSKNIPDIFSCNSRKHCRIFIMFGIRVTEEVSNQ